MSRRTPRSSPHPEEPVYTEKDVAVAAAKQEAATTAGPSTLITPGLYHLFDFGWILSLVFGGCCAFGASPYTRSCLWTHSNSVLAQERMGV
jgi:hypothetical protein